MINNPLVLVQRTATGDAYRYSRFEGSSLSPTHIIETDSVPVGARLHSLSAEEVEQFRKQPATYLGEL